MFLSDGGDKDDPYHNSKLAESLGKLSSKFSK